MYKFSTQQDLINYIASEVIDTSEAMEILQCSRQNIDDLVSRGKLSPIKKLSKSKLFFRADVLQRVKPSSKS